MKRRDFIKPLFATGATVLTSSHLTSPATAASVVNRKRVVRFGHLTDVHLYGKRRAAEGLTMALHHIQSLPDAPDFLINGGDAIYDALEADRETLEQQWKLWNTVWKAENTLPVKHCLGNHDVWGWNQKKSGTKRDADGWGKRYSLDQLGLDQSHYSFDQGGWRIIVLDSITADDETVYRGELGEAQFEWLQQLLQNTSADTPVVIVSHIPILTVGDVGWSRELAAQPLGHKMLRHQDRGELLQLFRQHPNVKLCLSGHTHLTEQIQIAGIHFVNSGAISGLWWKGNNAHTDEGYSIIDLFNDGTFESTYVNYGWDA